MSDEMKTKQKLQTIYQDMKVNKQGLIVYATTALLAVSCLVSCTLWTVASTDLEHTAEGAKNLAYYHAAVGIEYVLSEIETDIKAGFIRLEHDIEEVNYSLISETLDFEPVTQLNRLPGSEAYCMEVRGRTENASSSIEVVFKKRPDLPFGIFGDLEVDLKEYALIYSFDSSRNTHPKPEDSTSEVQIASNSECSALHGASVDGRFVLGKDAFGHQAELYAPATSVVRAREDKHVARINPDPLGIIQGDLNLKQAGIILQNDNYRLGKTTCLKKGSLVRNSGDSLAIRSGTYSFENLSVCKGATLTFDASSGPICIFLSGKLETEFGSKVSFFGASKDFFFLSSSPRSVRVCHNGAFKGFVYAPLATVEIKNSSDFMGQLWGRDILVRNAGSIYLDTALTQMSKRSPIALLSWQHYAR